MTLFIAANQWPKTEGARSYFMFATRIRELVHPQAQDIYRIHALSTLAKIDELISCCERVCNREYTKPTIGVVIDEANEGIESDPIVEAVLKDKGFSSEKFKFSISDPTESILASASLLRKLVGQDYRRTIEKKLLYVLAT